ncbi:hypothetical protein SARC_00762 [Sphaeroforma arctica JP610]|uniref:Uncharacterized protein n=1 Tax=Sphaeroforma arctica JP610 TaxID=667725 RepID=A0A0L0GDY9_9EUKA|nr:hypothetical protein SARC_00762 [Sphaeroforma arctica JP610]KNC87086.1 hypothetical protein SARC_00762 [Sphaeroforma arctica JP610]|eukprot:XP_014160988.1 hypothetical protein SARC_00762 [Sphaeroforma arctica JP610]
MEVTRKPRNLASNGDSAWDRGLRNGRKEQARFHRRKEAARFLSTISMKAEPNQAGVTPSANTSLHRVRLNINRSNEDLQVSHDDQRHGNGTGHGVAMADINSIDSRPMMQQVVNVLAKILTTLEKANFLNQVCYVSESGVVCCGHCVVWCTFSQDALEVRDLGSRVVFISLDRP